ncbi:class I SAM-dependent methyltransferase [Actinophytocola sp.]|uniref:class I SAM-dependent methyltransferase n=1 Tax=Actinophytocola sp. TaxID=1872138 RepID=UPI002D7E9355|nr:methyltransferase domain-containing protein [Actinophytocola sp.]HET9137901.1 methyltransferase domain-containing protein [Actinophytocola sp.]
MSALPPKRRDPADPELQLARRRAESFGADPQRYDRSRPRYPDALVNRIVAASPGPDVLDVGCGTGILARQFRAAGCTVLGVEPDARMADFARRGGLEVEVATFEEWESAGRAFDAVVAGQAWHWVDPDAGAVKAALVLRPGGRLAVFWNVFRPAPELSEAFTAVYRRVLPDPSVRGRSTPALPVYRQALPNLTVDRRVVPTLDEYSALITRVVDGIRAVGTFGDPQQWRFEWQRSYTRDEWLDQLLTQGGYGQLPPATLAELLAGIGAAIEGGFTMDYTTLAVTATRADTAAIPG